MNTILIIIGFSAAMLFVLSFFSGITWPVRIRILVSALLGIIIIGVLAWPLVKPVDQVDVINIKSVPKIIITLAITFVTTLLSYLLTFPQGSRIAIITVPFGLSVWAVKTANIGDNFGSIDTSAGRIDFYNSLIAEPILWLLIISSGFLAVYLCSLFHQQKKENKTEIKQNRETLNAITRFILGIAASIAIAYFLITILAQDVTMRDNEIGWIMAQPGNGQIAFAAFSAFACASFVTKKYFSIHYAASVIASVLLSIAGIFFYTRNVDIEYLTQNWPSVFFKNQFGTILPIQMVTFGTLGAIAGFWMVNCYQHWQKSEHHKMD